MFSELEILRLVGQGGMGAVYEARQQSLQRSVAVKLLPCETAADPTFVERFHLEAQTLAGLSHPNIVTVHDFGRTGQFCYFVMEYVDGGNLRGLLDVGPLPPRTALRIAGQVAHALAYAHARGVVHRDVKPENVLLETGDNPEAARNVKLADFGLVKLLALDPTGFMLTDPEHSMGTPHYMAPEQIERPGETDHRADVFALGVVLYEMLTGELPLGRFQLPSEKADVDPRLDELVLRCLEKEPERRYQQVAEVRDRLAAVAASPDRLPAGRPQPDQTPRRIRPLTVRSIGLLVAAVVVSLLAWQITIRIRNRGDGTAEVEIETSGDVQLSAPQPREPGPKRRQVNGPQQQDQEASTNERADAAAQAADRLPEVELSNAKLMGRFPHRLLRIEYRFRRGGPSPGRRYYLAIESEGGWIGEESLLWIDLGTEGTLRLEFRPPGYDQGPYETYLEVRDFRPGLSRRRISNIVKIEHQSP